MRRIFYSKVFIPLLAVTLLFANCKKGDDGATGPAGPAGANGAAGPQGPQGDPGTANVIYSAWLDVEFTADTVHNGATVDTIGYFADIIPTKLDSAMLSNGEMKVYFNFGSASDPDIVPLPFIFPINNGASGTIYLNVDFLIQDIYLTSNIDLSSVTQNGVKYWQYRYILIPGGTVTTRTVRPPDWNDYNAVKAFYGLKD
jgi:hypothetical protein